MIHFGKRISERGLALLLVLMTITIISAVVIEIMYRARITATVVTNRRDGEKAYELARAAVRWSIFRLQLDNTLDRIPEIPGTNYGGRKDDLSEVQWALPLPYPLAPEMLLGSVEGQPDVSKETATLASDLGGSFLSAISDESAKINLNDVMSGGPAGNVRWSGMTEVLENLLLSPRFQIYFKNADHRELLWAIDDWTDSDSQVNHLGGGIEDAEYQDDDPELHVKNAPFYTLRETRLLKPMTEELFQELKPFITVYPFNARLPRINTSIATPLAKINVNTAPLEIIAAIISRAAMPDPTERLKCAQEIVKYRANVVFRSATKGKEPSFFSALEQLCGLTSDSRQGPTAVSPTVQSIIQVRSDLFFVEATGSVGNTETTIEVVISRQNSAKPKYLFWRVS